MPIEIFKIALKLYEHWIPAFAGMTPAACRRKLNSRKVIPA
ncbi:MAG: hypothetical protein ACYDB5_02050 [bacterium]